MLARLRWIWYHNRVKTLIQLGNRQDHQGTGKGIIYFELDLQTQQDYIAEVVVIDNKKVTQISLH